MKSQNPKLAIDQLQMEYVTCVAFWNRLNQLRGLLGYSTIQDQDSYQLNYLAASLLLPPVIAQYVTSFGEVELASGTKIVPQIPDRRQGQMYYPEDFWQRAHPGQVPPANYWCLDPAWIVQWNENCSKGGKMDFGLRRVDYNQAAGSSYLCVSTLGAIGGPDVRPVAPQALPVVEAQVGAVFRYRRYEDYNHWPGENAELLYATHEGAPVYPRTVLYELCASMASSSSGLTR